MKTKQIRRNVWLVLDDADNLRGVFSTKNRGKKKAKELAYKPRFIELKIDRDRYERGRQ